MIDLSLYRVRISANMTVWSKIQRSKSDKSPWGRGIMFGRDSRTRSFENTLIFNDVGSFLYLYILYSFLIFNILGSVFVSKSQLWSVASSHPIHILESVKSFSLSLHTNCAFLYIVGFLLKILYSKHYSRLCRRYRVARLSPANFFFGPCTSRAKQVASCSILSLLTINFLLIAIANPSLLNPGPNNLSVFYHNVQGLIPFSQLNAAHPKLDHTKIYELNAHVEETNPDIVLLTET